MFDGCVRCVTQEIAQGGVGVEQGIEEARGELNGAKPRGEDRGWGSPVSSGREGAGAERKQNH